ncbi:hypothetical protein BJF83_13200 [Nocardiopsis sp. CNR-923]|nr:hypothetical protein BJF83_13200 [Nocardiopsis sp. CNR-923]
MLLCPLGAVGLLRLLVALLGLLVALLGLLVAVCLRLALRLLVALALLTVRALGQRTETASGVGGVVIH